MGAFAPWKPATRPCSGAAQPGVRAFGKVALREFPQARNGGIYACRSVVGGSTPSKHSRGEAIDLMCSIPVGQKIVKTLLRAGPAKLGIQCIIHNRRIYSARSPNGRPYGGPGMNPHLDHVHVEFTVEAARKLTAATVRAVLGGHVGKTEVAKPGERRVKRGNTGRDVAWLQDKLGIHGDPAGQFGDDTAAAVKLYQGQHGLEVDGVVGAATWRKLLGR